MFSQRNQVIAQLLTTDPIVHFVTAHYKVDVPLFASAEKRPKSNDKRKNMVEDP